MANTKTKTINKSKGELFTMEMEKVSFNLFSMQKEIQSRQDTIQNCKTWITNILVNNNTFIPLSNEEKTCLFNEQQKYIETLENEIMQIDLEYKKLLAKLFPSIAAKNSILKLKIIEIEMEEKKRN